MPEKKVCLNQISNSQSTLPRQASILSRTNFNFSITFILSAANALIWTYLKF